MRARILAMSLGAMLALTGFAHASDTLWIFDADFEDLVGDNAGWTSEDRSGTPPVTNYWHKDTIRIDGFAHLGDSTWWCGTVNPCWRQPRGYGNDWTCSLERTFLEVEVLSNPGDALTLEWDQRFAMERDYDYGCVDVSQDGGVSWSTVYHVTNPGFWPGGSQNWDDVPFGHPVLDLSGYTGAPVRLRFRVETDGAASSQDSEYHLPAYPYRDGAWQIDNIEWKVNGSTIWFDDCESPGDNGWSHDDIPGSGQTGVAFDRYHFENLGAPEDPRDVWVMGAFDPATEATVDGELAVLFSPAIDIGGIGSLAAEWTAYVQCPSEHAIIGVFGSEHAECFVWSEGGFDEFDEYDITGDIGWASATYDWSGITGGAPWWLHVGILQTAEGPAHGAGFLLDRFRVGVLQTGVSEPALASALAVHPNPFNPTTTIEYSVPSAGHVTLSVYDLAGRRVATLVEGELPPGPNEVTWDGTTDAGTRAASGVYFVRLTTETTEATGRLVLLK